MLVGYNGAKKLTLVNIIIGIYNDYEGDILVNDIKLNLSESIQKMLEYKESLGYSRKTYEDYLMDFRRYFIRSRHETFPEDTVLPWCEKGIWRLWRGRRRGMPLRELSKSLYAMGAGDFVPTGIFLFFIEKSPISSLTWSWRGCSLKVTGNHTVKPALADT